MAKMIVKAGDAYMKKLSSLGKNSPVVAKMAIYEGAKILTDAIRENIKRIPEDKFRYLEKGEKFDGVPSLRKQAMLDKMGIMKISLENNGEHMTRIGWSGYADEKTKSNKYPRGLPVALIARSVEKGTSVRKKRPFVRPAIQQCKEAIIRAMDEVIDREVQKYMKR